LLIAQKSYNITDAFPIPINPPFWVKPNKGKSKRVKIAVFLMALFMVN
jgi:hypothetical protein